MKFIQAVLVIAAVLIMSCGKSNPEPKPDPKEKVLASFTNYATQWPSTTWGRKGMDAPGAAGDQTTVCTIDSVSVNEENNLYVGRITATITQTTLIGDGISPTKKPYTVRFFSDQKFKLNSQNQWECSVKDSTSKFSYEKDGVFEEPRLVPAKGTGCDTLINFCFSHEKNKP